MELHVIEHEGRETVVLLDNEMRIVKPVYDYLKFQRQKDKALNTLKASGSDLRTYWEFLETNGYEYDKVTPKMIAEFIDYLRASDDDVIALNKESKRTNKTINRILSTVHMFYQFEADMQEIDNPILMHDVNRPFNAFKYGIIILQSTGMRIGDLLKLRIDCIKPHLISGYTIEWTQHKGRKDKAPMPVRSECVAAIEKLIEITAEFRDEADEKDKDTLMIWRAKGGKKAGQVYVPTERAFMYWLDDFTKEHNIKDANGDYYNLTSHQFRRTLGTDMLSKGTNINVIQQVLGHSDPSVTKRFYADVKDKERAEVFKSVGVIGNINQIQSDAFDNVSEFEWFKANKDKCVAGLCDGYCTKPVTDGNICPRLLKRQKCYTCSRYITTPEYLEAHKQHLANLEKQLGEGAIYGEHYAEHFIPTIEVLKVIIERLEGLQSGN